jgi:hypothetical protein
MSMFTESSTKICREVVLDELLQIMLKNIPEAAYKDTYYPNSVWYREIMNLKNKE